MKSKCLIISVLVILKASVALPQLVTTVAGQAGLKGEIDGIARLDALFNNPHGIASDSRGNVYIADRFNHKIRLLTPSGEVVTLAGTGEVGSQDGPGGQATFHEPWGLAVDSQGNVYIADTQNNKIRKIDSQGNVTTLAGSGTYGVIDGPGTSAQFAVPTGITIDNQGVIYVCDHIGHTIRKVSSGGYVTTMAGIPFSSGAKDGLGSEATFNRPYGIEVDDEGNVIVADEWNHLIRRVTPAGVVSTLAGDGTLGSNDGNAGQAQFNYPWDVTIDTLGNVYVMDGDNHVIRKISPLGVVSTFVGEAGTKGAIDGWGKDASFNGATALCMGSDNASIFVADAYNHLIRRVGLGEGLSFSSPDIAIGDSICVGETLDFIAFPETYPAYDFFVNGQLALTSVQPIWDYTFDEPGSFELYIEAESSSGTLVSPTLTLRVAGRPTIDFTHTIVSESMDSMEVDFMANLTDAVDWRWDFGDEQTSDLLAPTHSFTEVGTYSVMLWAESAAGCADSLIKVDLIEFSPALSGDSPGETPEAPGALFLPSAFTPNGDGLNDQLFLRGKGIDHLDLCILNEWGEVIFHTNDPLQGWDGTYRGADAPSDTYVCVANVTFENGTTTVFSAQTTILR